MTTGGRRAPGTLGRNILLEELRALISHHAGRVAGRRDGVQFAVVSAPTAPTSSIASPTLAVVAQGTKRLVVGDSVHDYGAGDYAVVTVDLPVTGFFSQASRERPFLGVGIMLRPDVVAALLLDSQRRVRNTRAPAGIGVAAASDAMLDATVRRLRLLGSGDDEDILAPLVEREIMWRLLTGAHGETVRQIGLSDSSLTHIGRTISWIRENFATPFRVEDLAERASLSVSAYHRQFRAVTSMSPIQFQKKVRLQQARLLLVSRRATVLGASSAVGYDSPSQFNREYRREFGRPPGQDSAILRSAPAEAHGAGLP
ncbi:AraC family transcriptional regulator [Mangrovihabitans endophyticus]|uniref:AraC family transcriptional regulator n=1 Tax=Mangrovihabitans endophyticus TaxID=1751298 RepID=A0A8J3BVY7_9ACTN|nr:AraC family transcriptional regulator [Mangrovihabitans endophyticus]GGK73522.1 AraC family transcriptional regulator [Mangrovihabitans endophyticus]